MMKMESTAQKLGRFCMAKNKEEIKKSFSYFYVLWCKDNTLYGGYTTDLTRREEEHNSGTGAKYTRPKTRRPLQMIYAETFETKPEAMRAEYAFKQLTRAKKEQYLDKGGVQFPLSKKQACVVKEVTELANTTEL